MHLKYALCQIDPDTNKLHGLDSLSSFDWLVTLPVWHFDADSERESIPLLWVGNGQRADVPEVENGLSKRESPRGAISDQAARLATRTIRVVGHLHNLSIVVAMIVVVLAILRYLLS